MKSATHSVTLGLFLSLCSFVTVHGQDSKQRLPSGVIRVNVDRINVGVTVTDSVGRAVNGLRREDFRIFDNGQEQPITGFAPSDGACSLVFLVESSTADYFLAKLGHNPFLNAQKLLDSIAAVDRIAVVTYSDEPRLFLDFTTDKAQALMALRQLSAQTIATNVGSGWLDLTSSLAGTIDWLTLVPGNKVILLISTGVDTSPANSWEIVQEKLRMSDVRVLAISIFGDFRKFAKSKKLSSDQIAARAQLKRGMVQTDDLLRQICEPSGGHAYFPKAAQDFDRAYAEIAQLVRGEYAIEFVPPVTDGKIHNIMVKVTGWKHHASYRQSYRAPTP